MSLHLPDGSFATAYSESESAETHDSKVFVACHSEVLHS